uniref:N-ribosyldihydronicotinamide:quinone dehydrogenase 2 n=1 Tax=Neolamprologus brichardi TaxID=32507 RepID=A0A3Q4FXX0_NEOBR
MLRKWKNAVLHICLICSPASFNAAARDVALQELKLQGYEVVVSDLYAMNFKASATRDDIIGDVRNSEHFQYGEETLHAGMEGRLSEDIVAEQRKVTEAELIIFQFPLYWFSFPAVMKGWIDRVLSQGFAFSLEKMYDNGIFKDKKAMLSFTTGAAPTMFQPDGINGDINVTLWPLQHHEPEHTKQEVLRRKIKDSVMLQQIKQKNSKLQTAE